MRIRPSKYLFLITILLLQMRNGMSQLQNYFSKNTLTAMEFDIGETAVFTMENKRKLELKLLATETEIVFTTLDDLDKPDRGEGTIYKISCDMEINGQIMTMERFVPVKQTFTDPYMIHGCCIWFDAVKNTGKNFTEKGGKWLPQKDARFAVWEVTKDICPGTLADWYPGSNNYIDIRDCYNGDDTWLGPYFGGALHGGLDINMPVGTPLYAPLDFDDHYLFASLAKGDNNNRWRGVKNWKNGDTWFLQTHHLVDLLKPEHEPISRETKYAYAAGILAGDHSHTHFVFKTITGTDTVPLDPWLIFWKIFEDNKSEANDIKAFIEPLLTQNTGKNIRFSSTSSKPGVTGNELNYYWKFGDGGISILNNPTHTYTQPGIYPVSLIVDDGTSKDIVTQHVIVNGNPVHRPAPGFTSLDELGFLIRDKKSMNVNGENNIQVLKVQLFCRTKQAPLPQKINIVNTDDEILPNANIQVNYIQTANQIDHLPNYRKKYYTGYKWLNVTHRGDGNTQELVFEATCTNMEKGETRLNAIVHVEVPGVLNSPAVIPVQLYMPDYFEEPPVQHIIVDDSSPYVTRTDWFWLSPRMYSYEKKWSQGYGGSYLINAGPSKGDEFVRYRPDLEGGRYQLSFTKDTPFTEIATEARRPIKMHVRVHHKDGISEIVVHPMESLHIGKYEFVMGKSGYVDIVAPREKGVLTVADAIVFKEIQNVQNED